jgi:hypothetical protein
MSRFRAFVAGGLALALGVWAYSHLERVPERVYTGYSGEAARNPLLAFQRLVERMGGRASTLRKAAELDALPREATLVLARRRYGMTPSRAARVRQWIESGGHLVVEAERVGDPDVLLDMLGVVRQRTGNAGTIPLTLPGSRREYRVMREPMAISRPHGDAAASSHADTMLVEFRYGRGHVSALSGFHFMRNHAIGELDHAAYAWGLIGLGRGPDAPAPVVLVAPGSDRPSLVGWLAENAAGAVAAIFVLLALWLARKVRRFGPVVPQPDGGRRRLLDHLRASGRFEWSAHAAPRLLGAAREACLGSVARARPLLAGIDGEERVARFAELTGLAPADVEHALAGEASTPRSFTAAVRTLQAIEEKLARRTSL